MEDEQGLWNLMESILKQLLRDFMSTQMDNKKSSALIGILIFL
uniref:Uncharacterized protein n=1 Tax=virus sp. ctkyY8 TaxID=2827995 RepID=A0A8S5RDV8_9VIRU|nr:MAG TPA: hypothetical protein [virus sp. ctkyY8]